MKAMDLLPVLAGVMLAVAACDRRDTTPEQSPAMPSETPAAAAPQARTAATPSFDCNRPLPAGEAAICTDGDLAELDNELDRLFRLVDSSGRITDQDRIMLRRMQDEWKGKREACAGQAQEKGCMIVAYARRIADIRAIYPVVRNDAGGVSFGPVSWRCDGHKGFLVTTFINSSLPVGVLNQGGRQLVATGSAAPEGTLFQAPAPEGTYEFINADQARFTVPGAGPAICVRAETAAR